MGELAPLVTAGGGLGVFAIVIIYLLANNRSDRGQANTQISDAEKRADAAEGRAERLQKLLDEARAERRAAEDREAAQGREVAKLREDVSELSRKVELLQESVT